MNWTKIPTDLIKQRIPDNEVLAIVKYQLLWADLEYRPDDETALRYITNKQLTIVKRWLATIETQVTSDINSVNKNRNNRKISYRKNKGLDKNVMGSVMGSVIGSVRGSVEEVDKIRLDKIREEKEINKEKEKKYAFNGKVVKLTQKDFDAWRVAYPELNLYAECLVRDEWLSRQEDTSNWFLSTAKYFVKQNEIRKKQHEEDKLREFPF